MNNKDHRNAYNKFYRSLENEISICRWRYWKTYVPFWADLNSVDGCMRCWHCCCCYCCYYC